MVLGTDMPKRKCGLLSRRATRNDEIIHRVLAIGEVYRGIQITASSPADLEQKRRAVDRSTAKRLFDALDAEARASILAELHPPPQPRPARRRSIEQDQDAETGAS